MAVIAGDYIIWQSFGGCGICAICCRSHDEASAASLPGFYSLQGNGLISICYSDGHFVYLARAQMSVHALLLISIKISRPLKALAPENNHSYPMSL